MPACVQRELTVSVDDTECIDLEGSGSVGNPLTATPVFSDRALHPLFGDIYPPGCNGVECGGGATPGLVVAPDAQIGAAVGSQGPGTLPTIVGNVAGPHTGGTADWGPRLEVQFFQVDDCRAVIYQAFVAFPTLFVTLEPGASVTYGNQLWVSGGLNAPPAAMTLFFDSFSFRWTNTSPVTQSFVISGDAGSVDSVAAFLPGSVPLVDFHWYGWQNTIATSGFTGVSSVGSGFFGAGIGVEAVGFPV